MCQGLEKGSVLPPKIICRDWWSCHGWCHFFLVSFISRRLAQGLRNLSCNVSFIWRDQGGFHLFLEDLHFVSLQRHDFQALKDLEMPLARRKPEYCANTCAESTPFMKDCCPCVPEALGCITLQVNMMGYSVYYNLSLDVMTEIETLEFISSYNLPQGVYVFLVEHIAGIWTLFHEKWDATTALIRLLSQNPFGTAWSARFNRCLLLVITLELISHSRKKKKKREKTWNTKKLPQWQ